MGMLKDLKDSCQCIPVDVCFEASTDTIMSYGDEDDDFNYDSLRQEEFEEILTSIVENTPIEKLFAIPGVYEILAEEFNNKVLDIYKERHENRSGAV